MSDPRPLTLPDGTVHAYACGVCLKIGGGGTVRGNGVNGWTAIPADRSLDYATSCCVCRTCNAPSPHENECDDCRAKWRAQMAALDAERAALAVTSVPGDDAEHYTLMVNEQSLDVVVEDEFGVYTRATIRHRDADDPTRNRDWSESSRCGGFAILQACADVASAFDAETVTLVPKGAVILDAKTAAHMADVCERAVKYLDAQPKPFIGMVALAALADMLRGKASK